MGISSFILAVLRSFVLAIVGLEIGLSILVMVAA